MQWLSSSLSRRESHLRLIDGWEKVQIWDNLGVAVLKKNNNFKEMQ